MYSFVYALTFRKISCCQFDVKSCEAKPAPTDGQNGAAEIITGEDSFTRTVHRKLGRDITKKLYIRAFVAK